LYLQEVRAKALTSWKITCPAQFPRILLKPGSVGLKANKLKLKLQFSQHLDLQMKAKAFICGKIKQAWLVLFHDNFEKEGFAFFLEEA
jgi:hypothetical protein